MTGLQVIVVMMAIAVLILVSVFKLPSEIIAAVVTAVVIVIMTVIQVRQDVSLHLGIVILRHGHPHIPAATEMMQEITVIQTMIAVLMPAAVTANVKSVVLMMVIVLQDTSAM